MEPARKLVRDLIGLRRSRASSAIDVRLDDAMTTLFVRDGELIAARGSKPTLPIGRLLVRRKRMTREQYIDVLQRLGDAAAAGQPARFGEMAVGLGYAKPEDVATSLVEQLRWPAVRLFVNAFDDAGTLTWTLRELPADARSDGRRDSLALEECVLAAVRRLDVTRRVVIGFAEVQHAALAPEWPLPEIDLRFDLTPDEAEVLRTLVGGTSAVGELCEKAPAGIDSRALATTLVLTGAAVPRAPGAGRGYPPADRRAPRQPPEWAYVDLAAAKELAARAVLARGSSSNANAPETLFGQMLRAEQSFERGRELFRRGDIKRALPELEISLGLDPARVECDLLVRWSRLWMKQEGLAVSAAEELYVVARRALVEDPDLAFGHFVVGEAEHVLGRLDDARRHLVTSLRLEKELFEGIRDGRLATMRATGRATGGRPPSQPELAPAPGSAASVPVFPKSQPSILVGVPAAEKQTPYGAPAVEESRAPGPALLAPASLPPPPLLAAPPRMERSRPLLVLGGVLALVLAGAVLGVVAAGWELPTPKAGGAPSAVAIREAGELASAPPSAVASAPPSAVASAPPSAVASAPPSAVASADAPALDPSSGRVRLPRNALGHRVFVDGKLAGSSVESIVVPCGHHEIRVGSEGAKKAVEVPCGGEIDLR